MFKCFKFIKDILVQCYYFSLSQVIRILPLYNQKTIRFVLNVIVYRMQSAVNQFPFSFFIKDDVHPNAFISTIISNLYFPSVPLKKWRLSLFKGKTMVYYKFHYSYYKVRLYYKYSRLWMVKATCISTEVKRSTEPPAGHTYNCS